MNRLSKQIILVFVLLLALTLSACDQGDKTLPEISGITDVAFTVGDPEPNYLTNISANDNVDGDLSSAIMVDDSAVVYTVPGTYSVSVSVTDKAGNVKTVTFNVVVSYEKVLPVISGTKDFEIEAGQSIDYLAGVSASDNVDGDLTSEIEVDDSAVNYSVVGEYEVTYSVADAAGNEAVEVVTVSVKLETVDPVIEGAIDFEVVLNSTPNYLSGLTASDNLDGNLTSEISVDASLVNLAVRGVYDVVYTVTDASGNSTSVTVSVTVKDVIAPEILNTRDLSFPVFSELSTIESYLLARVTATDNLDGDLTSTIIYDFAEVNLSVLGVYPAKISVSDIDGNETVVTIQLSILDFTAPNIFGTSTIYFVIGGTTPDYLNGITASDNYDGDVTSSIVVDASKVNLSSAGNYVITYSVKDSSDKSKSVNATVVVVSQATANNLETDVAAIDLGSPVTTNITLPTAGANGTTYTWTTLDPYYVSSKGKIVRPAVGEGDLEVTLKVTAKNGSYIKSFELGVVIAEKDDAVVTSKATLNYYNLSEEYTTADNLLETYFVDNGSSPYVDLEDMLRVADGAILFNELVFNENGEILVISYDLTYDGEDGSEVTETLSATFDFNQNIVSVEFLYFFDYYVNSTASNYSEGLTYMGSEGIDPTPVTFDLGAYGFDMVTHDDNGNSKYLVQFHVANLLFFGGMYYDLYYNGDAYYGVDSGDLFSRTAAVMSTIRTSSYNSAPIPADVKLDAYQFLAFSLDHYYGLKGIDEVETYRNYYSAYSDNLAFASNDYTFYRNIFESTYDLNDLHTSFSFAGYYEAPSFGFTLALADLGPRVQNYYNRSWSVEDLYEGRFGTSIPNSRVSEDGLTAIIYIEGFTIDTPPAFKRTIDELPETVENVVIDLANNGGGNLGAVLRIFGYMTEQTYGYSSQNPLDGSASSYFYESEYVAYDYNWYVMTSAVTFSAANLFASMAKEYGIATIIGQKSSGGASSIQALLIPGGATIIISSNNVLSTRVPDGESFKYQSIEYGIDVDYELTDITDTEEISELVNSISGN